MTDQHFLELYHAGLICSLCQKAELLTEQEVESGTCKSCQVAERIAQFFDSVVLGSCPICGKPITRKRQRGLFLVGYPCGHQLFQQPQLPLGEKEGE